MRIPILMYHMVNDQPQPADARFCCRVGAFRRQMEHLRQSGYQVIRLDDVLALEADMAMPGQKPVAVTFDDGYLDNYENALPILAEFGFPSTLFVVTDCVGGENTWMQGNGSRPRKLMSWRHLQKLPSLQCSVGSHTRTHIDLAEAKPDSAWAEIEDSKKRLEDRLGRPVAHFAYPYGRFSQDSPDMVKQSGYQSACSTRSGFNTPGTDPFVLHRIEVYGSDSLFNFRMKLLLGTNDGSLQSVLAYYWSRVLSRVGERGKGRRGEGETERGGD